MTDAEIIEGLLRLLEEARKKDLKLTLVPRGGEPKLESALRRAAQALKILDVIENTRAQIELTPIDPTDGVIGNPKFRWIAAREKQTEKALQPNRIACSGEDVYDALGQLTLVLALSPEEE